MNCDGKMLEGFQYEGPDTFNGLVEDDMNAYAAAIVAVDHTVEVKA
jgi:hypothetical protein